MKHERDILPAKGRRGDQQVRSTANALFSSFTSVWPEGRTDWPHGARRGERFAQDNRDVHWCDHLMAGFIMVHVMRDHATADFIVVPAPRKAAPITRTARRLRTDLTPAGPGPWRDA